MIKKENNWKATESFAPVKFSEQLNVGFFKVIASGVIIYV